MIVYVETGDKMGSNKFKSKKEYSNEIRNCIIRKNYCGALEKINEYINIFDSDCYIQLEMARYYREIGDIESSEKLFLEIIEEKSKNMAHAMYDLGKLYEKQCRFDEAIQIYKKIEQTNYNKMGNVYFSLGNIYYLQKQFDDAEICFNKSMKYEIKKEESILKLVKIKIMYGEYNEAERLLNNISLNDKSSITCKILLYKAEMLLKQERKQEYIETINKILDKYDSNYVPALLEKIQICIDNKNLYEAKKIYEKIKNKLEKSPRSLHILSNYHYETNDYLNAKKVCMKLIKLNSNYEGFVLLRLGMIELREKNYIKAKEYFKQNIEKHGNYYIESIIHYACIEIVNGNYLEALNILELIGTEKIKNSIWMELERIKLTLDVKLNRQTVFKNYTGYAFNQIINYNNDNALEHIKRHTVKGSSKYKSIFNDNINIEQLFNSIQNELTEDNLYDVGIVMKYKIFYKNIGYIDETPLDYLIVVTNLGTKDIITMYPSDEFGFEENRVQEEPVKQKEIKRISQIEKFNKKYNL